MRKRIYSLTMLGGLLLVLWGCTVTDSTVTNTREQTAVDIRGQIVEVHQADQQSSNQGAILGAIRIEGVIEEGTRFDQASITITTETRIFEQRGQERHPITFAEVATGQRAEVRFAGPVMETYPVQGTAAEVVILQSPE